MAHARTKPRIHRNNFSHEDSGPTNDTHPLSATSGPVGLPPNPGITFNTRTADLDERHTPSVSNQWPRGPTPEPYAAAAPLGPAARSRVRGADSLAQALDLLANPHRIVDDRRLGDQTRVV